MPTPYQKRSSSRRGRSRRHLGKGASWAADLAAAALTLAPDALSDCALDFLALTCRAYDSSLPGVRPTIPRRGRGVAAFDETIRVAAAAAPRLEVLVPACRNLRLGETAFFFDGRAGVVRLGEETRVRFGRSFAGVGVASGVLSTDMTNVDTHPFVLSARDEARFRRSAARRLAAANPPFRTAAAAGGRCPSFLSTFVGGAGLPRARRPLRRETTRLSAGPAPTGTTPGISKPGRATRPSSTARAAWRARARRNRPGPGRTRFYSTPPSAATRQTPRPRSVLSKRCTTPRCATRR